MKLSLKMNVEEALLILDAALEQKILNDVQELVFHQSWSGQTYSEIAKSSSYNANYIKDVGYKLWKLLSKVFEEEVTKSNFRSVFRRQYASSQHVQVSKGNSLTYNVFEGGYSGAYRKNGVSVPSGASISQKRSVSNLVLPEALQSTLRKNIAFGQIGESQKTLVDAVLATALKGEDIKINSIDSQNIKTELLTVIPQFIKTKA